MAAALAAASQMPSVPKISALSGGSPGTAMNMPMTAVKMMSVTTLGFVSSK